MRIGGENYIFEYWNYEPGHEQNNQNNGWTSRLSQRRTLHNSVNSAEKLIKFNCFIMDHYSESQSRDKAEGYKSFIQHIGNNFPLYSTT